MILNSCKHYLELIGVIMIVIMLRYRILVTLLNVIDSCNVLAKLITLTPKKNGRHDMEFQLVNQRLESDCVIASIAMMAGKTYKEVYDLYANFGYSKGIDESHGVESIGQFKLMRKLGMEPFELDTAFGGIKGILSLPSLNVKGGAHACFYDGRNIFDPQTNREGKNWYPKQLESYWPSCYRITVDLNDPYTLEMVKLWMGQKSSQIERFEKSNDLKS